jgi:hypothetical protein
MSWGLHHSFDEDTSCFSIDGVSKGAQSSHAGGSPISQRACAGFNWAVLSVEAGDPFGVVPEPTSRACIAQLKFLPLAARR